MSNFNEHTLEIAIMELFEQQGYSYVNGETIHKEQTEVLLRDDLRMYCWTDMPRKASHPWRWSESWLS